MPEDDISPVDPSSSDPAEGSHLGSYSDEATNDDENQYESDIFVEFDHPGYESSDDEHFHRPPQHLAQRF